MRRAHLRTQLEPFLQQRSRQAASSQKFLLGSSRLTQKPVAPPHCAQSASSRTHLLGGGDLATGPLAAGPLAVEGVDEAAGPLAGGTRLPAGGAFLPGCSCTPFWGGVGLGGSGGTHCQYAALLRAGGARQCPSARAPELLSCQCRPWLDQLAVPRYSGAAPGRQRQDPPPVADVAAGAAPVGPGLVVAQAALAIQAPAGAVVAAALLVRHQLHAACGRGHGGWGPGGWTGRGSASLQAARQPQSAAASHQILRGTAACQSVRAATHGRTWSPQQWPPPRLPAPASRHPKSWGWGWGWGCCRRLLLPSAAPAAASRPAWTAAWPGWRPAGCARRRGRRRWTTQPGRQPLRGPPPQPLWLLQPLRLLRRHSPCCSVCCWQQR
jgi:hypothetical protein